jgi:hypothetical protein
MATSPGKILVITNVMIDIKKSVRVIDNSLLMI